MKFQVIEDTADTISCRFDRRPSACTVAIFKADGSTVTSASATGVTLGAQCTVAADAGVSESDRRAVTLAATGYSGLLVRRPYRLTNSAQQFEHVQFTKLPTGRAAVVSEELEYDYAAGDTVEDTVVYRAITAAESVDIGLNFRARFTATVSGSAVIKDVLFDVVKSKLDQPITAANISDFDPMINRYLPVEIAGTDWERQLEKAWDLVYQDLVSQGLHPSRLLDEKQLAILHYHKFKVMLGRNGITASQDIYPMQAVKDHQFEYVNQMQLIRNALTWNDDDEDLIADENESNETPGRQYPRYELG